MFYHHHHQDISLLSIEFISPPLQVTPSYLQGTYHGQLASVRVYQSPPFCIRGSSTIYSIRSELHLHSWLLELLLQERNKKQSHTSQPSGNMAPDLNSLPPSPHSPRHIASATPRRARDVMAPPPAPISPPAQSPIILSREPAIMTSGDNTGVGIGPGMRA